MAKTVTQAISEIAPYVPDTATIYVRETSGYCIAKSHVRPFMAVVEGKTHVDANITTILRETALKCTIRHEVSNVCIYVTVGMRFK